MSLRRFHAALTLAWAAMIPVSIVTGWIWSIAFISACSIYANMGAHFGAWQATRAEDKADPET